MEVNKVYNESCLDTLSRMPDKFLNCVITSPPYWQLRDYGYNGQWGLEPTYQEYLEHLWSMMDLIWYKIQNDGTVWINLGDTYSTQSGVNTALSKGEKTWDDNVTYLTNRGESRNIKKGNLPPKCLLLLPHRFAIGCIKRGWILRNDIIWAKTNGMPESVTDRFSKKHEFFFFFVKQQKYYFNLDAVRDKHKWVETDKRSLIKGGIKSGGKTANKLYSTDCVCYNENGKNPGDVSDFWDIPTKPSSESHYASYNDELLKKPIIAGCPENGIIYDPFLGTGTTAITAIRANRLFIGSEMSEEYCKIAEKRINPLLSQLKLF